MLFSHDVDVEILLARVFADDHAFVHVDTRPGKEFPALLQLVEGVGCRDARPVGHQRPRGAVGNLAHPFGVSIEERIHDNGAARVGEELASEADEPAAGNPELQAHPPIAVVVHVGHLPLADAQGLHHHPDKVLGHVNRERLHGLHQLAVDRLGHDLRLAHHQLVALSAHRFDEDGEVELASAHDLEGVGAVGFFHTQRDVGEDLFLEALAQVA